MSLPIEILVVDGDDDDAALTLRALADLGFSRVLRVKDGADALEFALGPSAASLRLVILDIGGLKVLESLKSDARTQAVPVVMMTSAGSSPADVARCYALGANSCIVKPDSIDEYSAAVVGAGAYWLTWNQAPA